jgi:hypothetical protein
MLVEQQIQYAQERKAGYSKDHLIYMFLDGADIRKNYTAIKNTLLNTGIATGVSQTLAPLTEIWSSGYGLKWKGQDPNSPVTFYRSSTDGDLVKTAGLQLIRGRDIDIMHYPSDSTACLINESAAKLIGFTDPIGQTLFDDPTTWHVVGVVKDFIMGSPYEPFKPVIFKGPLDWRGVMNIRLDGHKATEQQLSEMKKIFSQYNPGYPFEYHFTDESYAQKFNDEKLIRTLAALFAGLTIFISSMGLFGLSAYMAENRIREIGVRKVLGASVAHITFLLSKDFIKLVIIAIVIATPLAWYAMHRWLQSFDYRIHIGWPVFLGAGMLSICIALLTVSFQAIRAGMASPVKSLRSE